jgi:beta-lactamase regulating signal transducer with metallopeptidase domain
MNETTVSRMIAARTQLKKQEQLSRSIALHKYHRANERRRQNKIAGSMILLIALVIANAWAAAHGWGLQ